MQIKRNFAGFLLATASVGSVTAMTSRAHSQALNEVLVTATRIPAPTSASP
jgi:hypothetical protein